MYCYNNARNYVSYYNLRAKFVNTIVYIVCYITQSSSSRLQSLQIVIYCRASFEIIFLFIVIEIV